MPIWGERGPLTWRHVVPPVAVLLAVGCVVYTVRSCGRTPPLGRREQLDTYVLQLKHEDPGMVANAAEALGGLGLTEAREPLRALLSSEHPRVLGAVCAALGQLGDQASAGAILEQLDHDDWAVVLGAATGLGALRHRPAVERLTPLVNASHPGTRLAVVEALGQIGDPAALPALTARQQAPTDGLEGDPTDDELDAIRNALDEAIKALSTKK